MAQLVEEGKEEKAPKAPVQKKKTVDKWKKKKWYSILAPEIFERKEVAETVAEKPELLVGRTIIVNAGELAAQAKLRHIFLKFKTSRVEAQKAFTEMAGHEINDSYIRRLSRRRTSKVETVQDVKTKDGKTVRVKAVAITMRKATKAQETAMRKIMLEEIDTAAKRKEFSQFIQELIFGNTASRLFKMIKRISAIKRIEITKSAVQSG